MVKSELIAKMAEKAELTKKDTELALNAFMETVEEALASGDKVKLTGFGTFEVRDRKARQGINPQNPEEKINIPAKKVPAFKAGKILKEKTNQ